MLKFTSYAKLTVSDKAVIIDSYRQSRHIAGPHFDPNHLAACVADNVFGWKSGEARANAYSAVLTVLVMAGEIKVQDGGKR